MDCRTSGFPVLHSLQKFAQTHAHWVNDAIKPSHPLSPPSLLALSFLAWGSFPMSQLFTSSDYKYWRFSFNISPSNDYSRLLFFRIDRFDFIAVQGTHKRLQHHWSKASILQHSAFFMVQLSFLYMTTGKTIALTIQIFVSKVIYVCLLIRCLGLS